MQPQKAHKIIAATMFITLVIGVANKVYKTGKVGTAELPGFRFFIGVGSLYLLLTGLAEAEPEVGQNLGIAIATFSVLGEGGGVMQHFLDTGNKNELDTRPPKKEVGDPGGVENVYGSTTEHNTFVTRRNPAPSILAALSTVPVSPSYPTTTEILP